jgi:hypothetical protein
MFVSCVCCVWCVGSGLCDELITRSESCWVYVCVSVCDFETSKRGGLGQFWHIVTWEGGGMEGNSTLHNPYTPEVSPFERLFFI